MDPTALVHGAYLRRVGDQAFDSRGHFFAAAAEAMRRILVDSARRKRAEKHGGNHHRVEREAVPVATLDSRHDLLALDDALTRLAADKPAVAAVPAEGWPTMRKERPGRTEDLLRDSGLWRAWRNFRNDATKYVNVPGSVAKSAAVIALVVDTRPRRASGQVISKCYGRDAILDRIKKVCERTSNSGHWSSTGYRRISIAHGQTSLHSGARSWACRLTASIPMAWVNIKGHRYYRQFRRVNGRVVTRHIGAGAHGILMEQTDLVKRGYRKEAANLVTLQAPAVGLVGSGGSLPSAM